MYKHLIKINYIKNNVLILINLFTTKNKINIFNAKITTKFNFFVYK